MTLDLDALTAPTDSESPDAEYNPDVWELRDRLNTAIAEIRRLREENERARIVADHWREALCGDSHTHWAAHPLCMVLAALDGETDPAQLGITPGSEAERLLSVNNQCMGREW